MTQVLEMARNGVDTQQMYGTLDAITEQPELGVFQFRATNHWLDGSHNRTTIRSFYGAGQEDTTRERDFVIDAGEPAILLGNDSGPNPAEYLLHALAACLTTSLVYVAAARKVRLTEVWSTLQGDMDVRGALGLSDEVRNGFDRIRVSFIVSGDAPADKLREVVARARRARRCSTWSPTACPSTSRSRRSEPRMIDLTARTEPGSRLVALAEDLATDLATRAGAHDREASYPFASVEALRAAGYLAAPVPPEHGGMGVASVHDLLVAASRLARGDASVAIGANMHMTVLRNILRRWEMAVAAGSERRASAFAGTLEAVARDGAVIATAISEAGQDLTRPATTATRTETGWRIEGRKVFCTMSPAATVLFTAVTFVDDAGEERYGYARVPAGTPGVVVHDDWDALGMRASGSNTVSFEAADLPEAALRGGFPAGSAVDYMESNLSAGLFHASASLGIAEAAQSAAVDRPGDPADARGRMLVANNAIELSAPAPRCHAPPS